MNLFIVLLISTQTFFPVDTTLHLPEIEVSAPFKQERENRLTTATTTFNLNDMENKQIQTQKDLSVITPNLYIPDYGSKMTSSIYIRGIGSRMEHPAMGLYVDNVPVMNKNNYEIDFFDIRRIDVLRGPQGTLYGRNTIGGVINIQTLSAFDYEGTDIEAGYGNANTLRLKLSTYRRPAEKLGYSLVVQHNQSDGFYTNNYNGRKCDHIWNNALRFRMQWKMSGQWQLDNVFNISKLKQDGFSYSLYNENAGERGKINHNDPCSYDRFSLTNGTTLLYKHAGFHFSSTTSFQLLDDKMRLDQDFTPKSMFTLAQLQKEPIITQEFIAKSVSGKHWQWLSGLFGYYKKDKMNAPVLFKEDGINELILENANNGIHYIFPDENIFIQETTFPIESRFKLPSYGVSLYHQSNFEINRWKFSAGIRLDAEQTSIDYRNSSDIHYRFTLTMPEYRKLSTNMKGSNKMSFLEFLPRFSASYLLNNGSLYATIARGYKTGGFNTQIFSDILQNRMMNGMIKDLMESMEDLGVYFDNVAADYDVKSAIAYKPEHSWNYELGGYFNLFDNTLALNATVFYIDIRNQQLTVFPPGKSTGRLMSNAGHTRSYGTELSANYKYESFRFTGSYGYTNAQFLNYNDGNNDYKGNYVPYSPQNTVFAGGEYDWNINKKMIDKLTLQLNWQGVGKIYWNENNTVSQDFYGIVNASLQWKKNNIVYSLWGKNLTNTDFNTFYFKSMGNSFVQQGKPLQLGISFKMTI